MKISHKLRKLVSNKKLVAAGLTAALLVAVPLAVKAEFYPNRPTYDYNKPCNPNDGDKYDRCGSMEGPVFNSFVNTPSYGDERTFLDARRSDQTAAGSYKNVLPNVNEGSKEVVMRMYIHNNANQSTNASGKGVAKNTKVRIALPQNEDDALRAVGYISADNATPKVVEDTVDMTASEKFRVDYIPDSAVIYSNGPVNGQKLSNSIVTTGASIGHDALNGNLPGCFEYEAVVQIRVKITPKQNPNLQLTKEVRKTGETSWHKEVKAKPGDEVQWKLGTKNISNANLTNVTVRDVLPPHVSLVPGSVRIIDASQNTQQQDGPLFTNNGMITATNQQAGGIRYVTFSTKALGDFDECEVRVRNVALARSDQTSEGRDDADVVIKKDNCEEQVKPKYACELLKAEVLNKAKREVRFTATASASGGATIERYRFTFGDGKDLTTDQNVVTHTYAEKGQYAARVAVEVRVDGQVKVAEGKDCKVVLTFDDKPETPCVDNPKTPVNECKPEEVPGELPNTGAGAVMSIFAGVSTLSGVAYHFVRRRLGL